MNRRRILLVDDEASFTRLLKLNLEQTGQYEVRIENGPEHALRTARDFEPDLILLDLVMPRLVGTEVASLLQADPALRHVPLVYLSAAPPRGGARLAPAFPLIPKPASVEEVLAGIEANLKPRPDAPQDPATPEPDGSLPPVPQPVTHTPSPWSTLTRLFGGRKHPHEIHQETHPHH